MDLTHEQLLELERIARERGIAVEKLRVFARISSPENRQRFSAKEALRAFGKPGPTRAD